MGFQLNTVIITGASNGIGEEMAYQLASQGAWLTLAARNEEKLQAVAKRCEILGSHMRGRVIIVPTDVTNEQECQALIEKTVQEYGRLDTLVNNAGKIMSANFEEMETLEPFHQLMNVNYFGAVYCTKYALPYLKQTSGRLVAVSSLLGRVAVPTYSGYVASKFALTGFFNTLRTELQESNVSVTILSPGSVDSGMHQRGFGADGKPLGDTGKTADGGMNVETCVKRMLKAIDKRKREELFTLFNYTAVVTDAVAPSVVEYVARRQVKHRTESD
ncbi:MAG: SDR family oxidoreductase [Anaerolineales bacterium]|nr:SDR family oxidoreductase [Anaerolineales bacterium]